MRPTTRSTGIAGLVALVALLFSVFAIPASAGNGPGLTDLPLHNDTADVEDDCPDTENDYWHFVVTPNNNTLEFVQIWLNIDGDQNNPIPFTGAAIIPGGNGQVDNVFVMVPEGYELDDLSKDGAFAGIAGPVRDNSKFNLSHVCEGTPEDTTTSSVQAETTTTVQAETTTTQAAVAGAVQAQPQFTG
jgi:hypothetical protein